MIPLHSLVLILMGRFTSRLRCIFVLVCHWHPRQYAGPFRRFPESSPYPAPSSCFRAPPTRRICPAGPIPSHLKKFPEFAVCFCHRHQHSGWSRHCGDDIQGMDCTLYGTFLLVMGYRLRQEVLWLHIGRFVGADIPSSTDTSPSSHPYLSISQPPGLLSSWIFSSSYSCWSRSILAVLSSDQGAARRSGRSAIQ